MNVIDVRMTQAQLRKLTHKAFSLTAKQRDDASNPMVRIEFATKKALARLKKAIKSAKGCTLRPAEINDAFIASEEDHEGGKINVLKSIKGFFKNKKTKGVFKVLTPALSNLAGEIVKQGATAGITAVTGNPLAGQMLGNFAGTATKSGANAGLNAYTGGNLFGAVMKTAKKVAVPALSKVAGQAVATQMGGISGQLAGQMVSNGVQQLGSGIAMEQGCKCKRKRKGGSFKPLGHGDGLVEAHGGSFKPLGGALSATAGMSPAERMAWVRSHRKK